jgi:hypothetical protein
MNPASVGTGGMSREQTAQFGKERLYSPINSCALRIRMQSLIQLP